MIGCDIVSISRIEKIYKQYKQNFLDKFLSIDEQSLIKNPASLAGLFAAKEAASKALGVGISPECSFFDIKLSKDTKNAPKIDFSGRIYEKFKMKKAALSIAHDGGFAIAVVILSF